MNRVQELEPLIISNANPEIIVDRALKILEKEKKSIDLNGKDSFEKVLLALFLFIRLCVFASPILPTKINYL